MNSPLARKPIRTFFEKSLKADDGRPVTVEYSYESHGDCVCIWEAWREPAKPGDPAIDVKLTDAEDERMCAWITEHNHYSDHVETGEIDDA